MPAKSKWQSELRTRQRRSLRFGGAILTGLVLGAIGVFIIEKDFARAAAFALAGAVLTFFGFMHGEAVGIGSGLGVTPSITLGYLMVAGVLIALIGWSAHASPVPSSQQPVP